MELVIKDICGKKQIVIVQPGATIGELKQLIAPHFEARASCLKLSARSGQILDNHQKTVSDYGLSSGSEVMLLISATPVPFQVLVRNEKSQINTYDVTDDETVDQLMTKVRNKEGVPVDQQRLIHKGRQLQCGRKLQDYNIIPGDTIEMTFRLRGG